MRHGTRFRTLWSLIGITAAPLLLAALGLAHPHELTPATASSWYLLHYVLLPVFPLLGVNIWWLLADVTSLWAWIGRILAFVYIPFYTALDVLAGMGTGLVMTKAYATNETALIAVNPWLFDQGNATSQLGVWPFLLACLLTSALMVQQKGRTAVPGAICLSVAAYAFLGSHIYYPYGVATMLMMALGFGWLQWVKVR